MNDYVNKNIGHVISVTLKIITIFNKLFNSRPVIRHVLISEIKMGIELFKLAGLNEGAGNKNVSTKPTLPLVLDKVVVRCFIIVTIRSRIHIYVYEGIC